MIHRRLEIVTPARTLVQEETGPDSGASTTGVRFHVTRSLLQDADDTAEFLKYLPPLSDADRREMRDIAAMWRQMIGDRGVLVPWAFAGQRGLRRGGITAGRFREGRAAAASRDARRLGVALRSFRFHTWNPCDETFSLRQNSAMDSPLSRCLFNRCRHWSQKH